MNDLVRRKTAKFPSATPKHAIESEEHSATHRWDGRSPGLVRHQKQGTTDLFSTPLTQGQFGARPYPNQVSRQQGYDAGM